MDDIQKWYHEASLLTNIHNTYNSAFLIYKGFKINLSDGVYNILDVRFSNTYSEVSEVCLSKIRKHGFIKGADVISFERDTKRVVSYKKRTEVLYDKLKKFKKDLSKNLKLNEKRIRNTNLRIDEYIDLMFFYKVRIQHFNNKYKQDETKKHSNKA